MYNCIVQTAPVTEPVSTADLKTKLRLNTTDEDAVLTECITTARQQFEHLTNRPVISQTIRQYCSRIGFHNCQDRSVYSGIVYLMKSNVISITQVKLYNDADALVTDTSYIADLTTLPARITWQTRPALSRIYEKPVYVDYVCGFSSVPADVSTAIKLLAAHYFENGSTYITDNLKDLPMGFQTIAQKYSTGIGFSDWGDDAQFRLLRSSLYLANTYPY